jgi:hypothetical protein
MTLNHIVATITLDTIVAFDTLCCPADIITNRDDV